MIKFKANIWETGNSWVVTIPRAYIKNNLVNPEREYEIHIHEVET